jgi:hypothetical protein
MNKAKIKSFIPDRVIKPCQGYELCKLNPVSVRHLTDLTAFENEL